MIIGIAMVIGSIVLGIYVGFYLFFIKGIVKIIELVKSDTAVAKNYVVPVVKVMLGGATAGAIMMLLGLPGVAMIISSYS